MSEYMALKIEERDRDGMSYYVGRCIDDNPGYTPMKCAQVVKMRAREILKKSGIVTDRTFSSLKSLIRSTSSIPGRKVVLLMSDGFYLNARDRNSSSFQALSEVTDAALRTGTIIYTIDARGLISGQADATVNLVDGNGVLDRANIGEIPASQDGLNALAVDTGGRAQRNTNSITNWVSKTLDETSNYYLLAWHSEVEPTDKKFKQIDVSIVGRPELNVRLPRGYITGAEKLEKHGEKSAGDKTTVDISDDKPMVGKKIPLTLSLNYLDAPNIGGMLTSSIQIPNYALSFDAAGAPATVDLAGIIFNDHGKQIADFGNLRLRDIDTLKIDRFNLSFHAGANTGGETKKYYDNVVAAKSYIGPMVTR